MDIKLQIFEYPTHVSRETHPTSRIIRTLIVYFSTRAAKHQYAFPSLREGFANNFTCKRVSYVLFVCGVCIFHIFKHRFAMSRITGILNACRVTLELVITIGDWSGNKTISENLFISSFKKPVIVESDSRQTTGSTLLTSSAPQPITRAESLWLFSTKWFSTAAVIVEMATVLPS